MMDAPSPVAEAQLAELHVRLAAPRPSPGPQPRPAQPAERGGPAVTGSRPAPATVSLTAAANASSRASFDGAGWWC